MDLVEINRPYPNHKKPIYMAQGLITFREGSMIEIGDEKYSVNTIIYRLVDNNDGTYHSFIKSVFLQPR